MNPKNIFKKDDGLTESCESNLVILQKPKSSLCDESQSKTLPGARSKIQELPCLDVSFSGKPKGRKKKSKSGKCPDSVMHQPESFVPLEKYEKSSEFSNDCSDLFSKLNSSDNMRKSQNRRSSVPNEPLNTKGTYGSKNQGNCYSPIPMTGARSSDNKNSKYRSKTPDYKTPGKIPYKKPGQQKKNVKFEPYIPLFQIQQGLKRGEFIEGALRINPRNYEDAYVSAPDGKMDIYIGGMHDRNRALNGDIVVVQINPKQEWKILCDAIKDHQEKSSDNVTIYKPITPSTPCKVHTPDTFFRSHPVSSNSWDSACQERFSDTVEILGIDRLADQFKNISVKEKDFCKHKSKRKSKCSKPRKDPDSQKSNAASLSQESSEDYLDKLPPAAHDKQSDAHSNTVGNESKNHTHVLGENTDLLSNETCSNPYPPCNMSEIGCFDAEKSLSKLESDSWNSCETSVNIIVSPEELLNIDGNSLLIENSTLEDQMDYCSSSDIDGIVVAPGELSGDEFTDSASNGSDVSANIEQVLEDAAFLACQQDAENNNIDNSFGQSVNQYNPNLSEILSISNSFTSKDVPTECRLQHNMSVQPLASVDVSSETIVCSTISEIPFLKDRSSSSDENNIINPLVIGDYHVDNTANIIEVERETKPSENKKSKHRKRKKKSNSVKSQPIVNCQPESKNVFSNIENLTVEELIKHPQWTKFVQKTGKVVHVLHPAHSRRAAGHLKLCPDKNSKWALFSPNDSRVPRIMVPMTDCPQNFYFRPLDYTDVLFLAEITNWNETSSFASGHLIKSLGNTGDVEAETEGILIENGVNIEDFSEAVLSCLPGSSWEIPSDELKTRRDLRKECIFTIDPASARDMDDAVSCIKLANGNYEVGVHIADVSYFVKENTELDNAAQVRSTSVYLVQKVIPMLPRRLCDDLCSLNPGRDRLTVSVIWEMTQSGEIVKQWLGRSIINSCIKLSYEHAQDMIERPNRTWHPTEHPEIFGCFSIQDVIKRVNELHSLAVNLREERFRNGALRLDKPQLQFALNLETGLPAGFNVYVQKDSNKLIEEFMLLANMAVAAQIYRSFPSIALLRRHPPPETKPMEDIVSMCESIGVIIDSSTSGSLQRSIQRYMGDDVTSQARALTLTNLIAKPMNCALYFCTGILKEPHQFHHYALNVPLYTHFTSPIRRYPDIIVHRLLTASLQRISMSHLTPQKLHKWTTHCNEKKLNAKKVSELSGEIFLAAFIRDLELVEVKAMVMGVMDHSFDCLILEMGLIKRVYCDKLPLVKKEFQRTHGVSILNLFWKDLSEDGMRQTIVVFTLVDVILTVAKDSLQIKVALKKPIKV